ncbi:MAG: hypothetical protein KYX68_10990 [Flavobacterium sp.]|nr:hypothetical protein [Flavobacterium sp.]
MEEQKIIIESLFEKVENYTKTSIELYKLKFIGKSSSLAASVLVYAFLIITLLFFVSFFNIALALVLGKWIGSYFLGFLVVAIFYLAISCLVLIFRDKISKNILETILLKILVTKNNSNEKK